jgi:hypothetical protein
MATQAERIARLESEASHLRRDMDEVKPLIVDMHHGLKWFIRGAKFTAACGLAILALKGAVSWSDVRDAFRGIV